MRPRRQPSGGRGSLARVGDNEIQGDHRDADDDRRCRSAAERAARRATSACRRARRELRGPRDDDRPLRAIRGVIGRPRRTRCRASRGWR